MGRRVEDVTEEPIFQGPIQTIAQLYDLQHDPRYRDFMTYASPTTGEPHSRQDQSWVPLDNMPLGCNGHALVFARLAAIEDIERLREAAVVMSSGAAVPSTPSGMPPRRPPSRIRRR